MDSADRQNKLRLAPRLFLRDAPWCLGPKEPSKAAFRSMALAVKRASRLRNTSYNYRYRELL